MINFSDSIEGFRAHVPVAREWAYLITASTGLVPDFVYDGVRRYLDERYLKGGDSTWLFDEGTTGTLAMLERSKAALAAMIGGRADRIAFGQSSTQLFTMVTDAVEYAPGSNVVAVDRGWIGNRFAWQNRADGGLEVRFVLPEGGVVSAGSVEALCDEKTAAVTVNLVESSTGCRFDLAELGRFCRERGILLYVDAVQAAGALKIDVEADGVDFLAGNDYKWMMNFCGTGYAYISERLQKRVKHWGAGWMSDTDRFDTSKAHITLREDAGRFEIGYPNAAGAYGLGLAAEQYNRLGAAEIENCVMSLAGYFRERVDATRGLSLTYALPEKNLSQIVSVDLDPSLAVTEEDFRAAKVFVPGIGVRPDGGRFMRVSFHYYNTREDIDRFFDVIGAAARR